MTLLTRVSQLNPEAVQETIDQGLDWDYIYQTSCRLGVAPLYYYHLKELKPSGLDETPLMHPFKKEYHLSMARNLSFIHEFDQIAERLSTLGIPCIGLKGISLSRMIYPNPTVRPMIDIDILVKKEALSGVDEVIRTLGYEATSNQPHPSERRFYYDLHYRKKSAPSLSLEIHWDLGEKNRYRIDVSKVWERAVPSQAGPFLEMSNDDTLVYLSLHFFKHYLFKRLIWLCDIYEWIVQKEINWGRVIELAQSQSIATFLVYTLNILEEFYKMPLPVHTGEILHIGRLRAQILNRYLKTYPMFHPLDQENWFRQRLFAFSCIDRMSDRFRFTLDALRRDLK